MSKSKQKTKTKTSSIKNKTTKALIDAFEKETCCNQKSLYDMYTGNGEEYGKACLKIDNMTIQEVRNELDKIDEVIEPYLKYQDYLENLLKSH